MGCTNSSNNTVFADGMFDRLLPLELHSKRVPRFD
jgi:hypothetical protein